MLVTGMSFNTDAPVTPEPTSQRRQGHLSDVSLLRFVNVAKEYATEGGRVYALRDLSLDVPVGSFLALVGRSGCGKSTFLNSTTQN